MDDFHATDDMFVNPAVRHPTAACVDEANCNFEKITLCAFNQTATGQAGVTGRTTFLVCMDETTHGDDAVAAATPCAKASSFDMAKINTCYNGAQGPALLEQASLLWNKYFPSVRAPSACAASPNCQRQAIGVPATLSRRTPLSAFLSP